MRALVLLVTLAASAGCLAAAPAHQTLIADVAPFPTAPPGIALSWAPPADPVALAADECQHFPWRAEPRGLLVNATIDLELQVAGNATGVLHGHVDPPTVEVGPDSPASGVVTICAPSHAPASAGMLLLVATAGESSVALASVGVETGASG